MAGHNNHLRQMDVVKPTVTACITCCRLVVRLFRLHCDLGDTA